MKIIDLEKLNNKAVKVQYEMFINEVNPFCSVTTTIDVSNLMKYKKKHHLNAMMMFCIQNAGEKTKMCHYQVNNQTSIKWFEHVCTNFVITGKDGVLYYPYINFQQNFLNFEKEYEESSSYCYENNTSKYIDSFSVLGTTSLKDLNIQSMSVGYFKKFLNPYIVWGKINKKFFKSFVNITFNFHHAIFAGQDISDFFANLQKEINNFKIK